MIYRNVNSPPFHFPSVYFPYSRAVQAAPETREIHCDFIDTSIKVAAELASNIPINRILNWPDYIICKFQKGISKFLYRVVSSP